VLKKAGSRPEGLALRCLHAEMSSVVPLLSVLKKRLQAIQPIFLAVEPMFWADKRLSGAVERLAGSVQRIQEYVFPIAGYVPRIRRCVLRSTDENARFAAAV
jgi:hypothetical protein